MNAHFYSESRNKKLVKKIVLFYFIAALIICGINKSLAQNVGINATGATPNTSAMLDVNSSTKGLLIPQVALTSATDVTTITTGNVNSLLVYNTATAGASPNNVVPAYYYWNATAGRWYQISANSGSTGNTMFSGFQVFTASGTFTLPTGVSRVMIEMWGGGGGGGGSKTGATGYPGSGGGGGAYNKSLFNVTANITVTIGTGGAGGAGGTGGNGTAGTATSVSGGAVMSAGGGGGGKGNDATGTLGTGGVPTATSASILGITGYQGGAQIGGGTGGPGGLSPSGGAGGQPNGTPGYAGSVPGGGGAGASLDGALNGYAGGAGAAGMVIIWW